MDVGFVKGKPRDYFSGYIEQDGIVMCDKIFGNYMGYADFDGERFFDLRNQEIYEMVAIPTDSTETKCLHSDARNRIDLVALGLGNVEQAQENKNQLEAQQRQDRKMREAAEKRRSKGGPKIVYRYEEKDKE